MIQENSEEIYSKRSKRSLADLVWGNIDKDRPSILNALRLVCIPGTIAKAIIDVRKQDPGRNLVDDYIVSVAAEGLRLLLYWSYAQYI